MESMIALYNLVNAIFTLYIWALFIYVIMGWLFYFQVINSYNNFVNTVYRLLQAIVEPALRPIRRFIPVMGGVDLSVLVLILGVYFLRDLVVYDILRPLIG